MPTEQQGTTLQRQLFTLLVSLLLLLLAGNFAANIYNARQYLQEQLQSHAQDAATSLGLSLSVVVDSDDLIAAASMIDAIYDSGYYREIVLYDVKGKPLIERVSPLKIPHVPGWFVQLIDLKTPLGEAHVMAGWQQAGAISVTSHPGFAYQDLWRIMQTQLFWFILIALLAYMGLRAVLGVLLRPLFTIERQAHAICERDFSIRVEPPRTRELRRVAVAMNEMSDRLHEMLEQQLAQIDQLRKLAYNDPITGVWNRRGFDNRVKAELESHQTQTTGSLFLLQIADFSKINQRLGRAHGDELMQAVADCLLRLAEPFHHAILGRRGGADFALFIPARIDEQADEFAAEALMKVADLPLLRQLNGDSRVHMGVASTLGGSTLSDLLSRADTALRHAQSDGPNGWHRYAKDEAESEQEVHQAEEWQHLLQHTLEHEQVELYLQPVYQVADETVLHHVVLARLQHKGQVVPAGIFIPLAERFGMLEQFDRLIVSQVLNRLRRPDATPLCVNLSLQSVADAGFVDWLEGALEAAPKAAQKLVFEFQEFGFKAAPDALHQFIVRIKQRGAAIAIDRFGVGTVPFSYLQTVTIDYLKTDHSFIRDIERNADNQFFLQSIQQIARSQGIRLVVVGVENEQEWEQVRGLKLDAAVGYYLGKPAPE